MVALLGHTGAPRALRALEPLLENESPELRRAAVEAIGMIGPGGARALLPLLDSEDPRIRFEAARNVGRAGDRATVAELLDRLERREPTDRHALLEALGPALERATPSGPLAQRAEQLLMQIARDRDEQLSSRAIEALARWGATAPLRTLATDGRGRRAEEARLALGRAPASPESLALLRKAVRESTQDWAAAVALGERGSAEDAEALLDLVGRGSWPASTGAAFALARLARREALSEAHVQPLCALARRRRSPHLRANLVVALAALQGRCETGEPASHVHPRSWMSRVHAPVVRAAAARWLAAAYPEEAEARLATCAESALSPDLRATCLEPSLPPLGATADVYAYAVDGETLLRRTIVALRLSDGSSLVVRTDANAHLRLENAPRGPLKLDDPLASPLEP